ncbi:hypothetical protein MTO96_005127 [Rhipicephalus appendiculatus]
MSRFGYKTTAVSETHGRKRGSKLQRGARMVTAETLEGELVRRHLDQVKPRVVVLDKEPWQPHLSPSCVTLSPGSASRSSAVMTSRPHRFGPEHPRTANVARVVLTPEETSSYNWPRTGSGPRKHDNLSGDSCSFGQAS